MEISGDKKSIQISSEMSPLFFHTVPKLVQALVITYYEIFQALAVKGVVLLPKPSLDPTPPHPQYSSGSSPSDFHVVGKLKKKKRLRGGRFPSGDTVKVEVQKCLREQDVFFHREGLENLIICYDKCLNKFGNNVERQRTDVQKYPCVFIVCTYLHSLKKMGNLNF
jgi:hypothetical protein